MGLAMSDRSTKRGSDRTTYAGDALRELREGAGVTQTALARELEVTQGTISRWETGKDPLDRRSWLACQKAIEEIVARRRG